MPHTVPFIFGIDESFDVGSDTGTPVDDKEYQVRFAFNGTLRKVTFKLEPPQLSPLAMKTMQEKIGHQD